MCPRACANTAPSRLNLDSITGRMTLQIALDAKNALSAAVGYPVIVPNAMLPLTIASALTTSLEGFPSESVASDHMKLRGRGLWVSRISTPSGASACSTTNTETRVSARQYLPLTMPYSKIPGETVLLNEFSRVESMPGVSTENARPRAQSARYLLLLAPGAPVGHADYPHPDAFPQKNAFVQSTSCRQAPSRTVATQRGIQGDSRKSSAVIDATGTSQQIKSHR